MGTSRNRIAHTITRLQAPTAHTHTDDCDSLGNCVNEPKLQYEERRRVCVSVRLVAAMMRRVQML